VAELSVGLIPAKPIGIEENKKGGGSRNRTIATMGIPFFEMLNEPHRRKNAFYNVFSNYNRKLSINHLWCLKSRRWAYGKNVPKFKVPITRQVPS
jgi:hypothetical protein